jgi:hypothetical protein
VTSQAFNPKRIDLRKQLVFALCGALLACASACSKKGGGGAAGSGATGTPTAGADAKSGTGAAPGSGSGANAGAGMSGRVASGAGAGGGGRSASGGGSGGRASSGSGGGNGPTAGTSAAPTGASVLERNNHPSRDGHFVQPTLTKAAAATMAKDTFAANFTGNMWASPLYFENGPGGKGLFFSVTTGNDVFALDEASGAIVWMKHLGDSPTANGVSCGNIHPLGILSTPVIDAASRTIYVAGAIGTTSIARHEVHALAVDDGTERTGWPVDVSKLSAGSLKFAPPPHNQRSALSLVNGIVYVAYGGHVGDCGDYHGWVVGIDAKDPTKTGAWASLGAKGEGIWAAGGMASDGTSVFAITGNNTAGVADHATSDGEEVVRITGLGTFDRADKNLYFPMSWRTMDSQDADFGASSPLYLSIAGATPANYVVAISKDGHMYLLDSANLGGMAGHVVDFSVAMGAMSIRTVPAAYTTAMGTHVVFSADGGARCPAGGPTGKVVMSVLIPPGSPPAPKVAWCATLSGSAAPIATTTDGQSEAIVWYMSGGKLTGVDGDTGAVVFNGGADTCTAIRQWTSPIAVKGRIVVGGDGHLCSWSVH